MEKEKFGNRSKGSIPIGAGAGLKIGGKRDLANPECCPFFYRIFPLKIGMESRQDRSLFQT